jgi:cysteinyl-tRNA synthetase
MSKSLGNFYTLRDLLARGFSGREIRYLLLTAHYREPFNFTLEGLAGARAALARLDECLDKLRDRAGSQTAPPDPALPERFGAALDDDLNVSAAWAAVFDWVRDTNRALAAGALSPAQAAARLAAWQQVDQVLGVGGGGEPEVPADILALAGARQAARQARNFAEADRLRAELKARGWLVEDTPKGPKLKRA